MARHGAQYDLRNLHAGEDLMPIEAVESALKHKPCPFDSNVSLLDYLCDPLPDVPPHRAASSILEHLAAQTEENASDSVLVFR